MASQAAAASYFQELEDLNISIEVQIASFALLLYDHLLTFPREVDLIWQQKFRPLNWLYILIRYPIIISYLSMFLNASTPHCTSLLQFSEAMGTLSSLANTAFQITRTYAIWHQSWLIACYLTILSLLNFILNIWTIIASSCVDNGFSDTNYKRTTISTFAALLFAISVVILTVIRTFQATREQRRLYPVKHSLASILVHNGSIYFLTLLSFNVCGVVLYYCAPLYIQGITEYFAAVLGIALASRFFLDLREVAIDANSTSNGQIPYISSVWTTMSHVHTAIAEEFGDPLFQTSHELQHASKDVSLEDITPLPSGDPAVIGMEEFPWATGDIQCTVESEGEGEVGIQDAV